MEVILTDHHTLPPEPPPCLALLHPACTPADSPYRGLAGVGLAYVLAVALAGSLGRDDATAMALDLFCIGTIADMAPLLGVNRRWLQEGLPRLHASTLPGLQALQRLAGVGETPWMPRPWPFNWHPASTRWAAWGIPSWWWSCSPPKTGSGPWSWPRTAKRSTGNAANSATRSKPKRSPWWRRMGRSVHPSFCWPRGTGTMG